MNHFNYFISLCLIYVLLLFTPLRVIAQEKELEINKDELPTLEVMLLNTFKDASFLTRALGINAEKENLTRRGEIIFFASFSYLWAYQFIFFDIMLSAFFNDSGISNQLSLNNFIFSIASTILLALMVTRKDNLFMKVEVYGDDSFGFFNHKPIYRDSTKSFRLLLDWFDQEF